MASAALQPTRPGCLRGRLDRDVSMATSKSKNGTSSFTVNGFLAGLVAITCPCYWVSPTGAVLLGGIAGCWSSSAVERSSIFESMIQSAQFRCTVFAASGERCRSAYLPAGKYGATGPFGPDNSAPLKGFSTAAEMQVLKAQFIGSALSLWRHSASPWR